MILGIVASLAMLLFYTAIWYYQQIAGSGAVKAKFYFSYGVFAGLEADDKQLLIVLQDDSVFDSREIVFYPLVQATGDILLYTYEKPVPMIVPHEEVKAIYANDTAIKI